MLTFHFSPWIDLPLAGLVMGCFLINAWLWSKSDNSELGFDLKERLPKALVRISLFFIGLTAFCWLTNIGFWAISAGLAIAGVGVSIIAGNTSFAPEIMFVATAGVLREWAFGFPNLILTTRDRTASQKSTETHELEGVAGVTISQLRPSGYIRIGKQEFSAVSDNGTLIEKGIEVVVVSAQNGRTRVRLSTECQTNGG